ncbi:MAG: tetratricopeptide repeat protein, partial [Sphingomonas sp.]
MRNATKLAKLIATMLAVTGALKATADVKAGVEAWTRGEYRKAIDLWRIDADRGDADAQFDMGQAYRLGRGVPANLPMASEWFRKAAAQGHVEAITNYGLTLFDQGKRAEALPWLERSVARGEPRAQMTLGTMLYNGDGVARDYPRAYALLVRAVASGLPRATEVQAQMDRFIPLAERQKGLELAKQYEAQAQRPELPPEIASLSSEHAPRASERLPSTSDDSAAAPVAVAENPTRGEGSARTPARPTPPAAAEARRALSPTRQAIIPISGKWR